MKIEKVNDNQIRCTLTKEDLEERQLKISEIAYGSEKAKNLFKDMMLQANYEFGFEADDVPLMVEAIPIGSGCMVFIITKVEDPEELDTRFSRFAPSVHYDEDDEDGEYFDDVDSDMDVRELEPQSDVVDDNKPEVQNVNTGTPKDLLNLFKQITSKAAEAARNKNAASGAKATAGQIPELRLFSFETLDAVVDASKVLAKFYKGESSLYKNTDNGRYYLFLVRGCSDAREFVKVCNLLMEYGENEKTTPAGVAFIQEHYDALVEDNAVASMAQL